MTHPKTSSLLLLVLGVGVLSLGVAACSSSSSGDDDDTTLTNCQVVWANSGSASGRFDIYLVDMPIEDWISGTQEYQKVSGHDHTAVFFDEMLVSSNDYLSRAISTAGTFSVTTDGTNVGDAVTFSDLGGHTFFDVGNDDVSGQEVGNGGAAEFSGVWSDVTTNPTPGAPSGRATLLYHGSALTIGAYTRYAVCYRPANGFAAQSTPDRISGVLRQQPLFRAQ